MSPNVAGRTARRAGERERVEIGAQVAVLSVGGDQPVHLGLEGGIWGGGDRQGGRVRRSRPGAAANAGGAGWVPGTLGTDSKYRRQLSSTALGSASHS